MYPPARNGNGYFQVYAFADGDVDRLLRPDRGVLIAVGNQDLTLQAAAVVGSAIAQAEFYYDQTSAAQGEDRCWGGGCGLEWDSYKENVLWNLRWRARLRYFREPGNEVDVNVLTDFPTGMDLPQTEDGEYADNYDPAEHLSHYAGQLSGGLLTQIGVLRTDYAGMFSQP
jgi:hypothetical protein